MASNVYDQVVARHCIKLHSKAWHKYLLCIKLYPTVDSAHKIKLVQGVTGEMQRRSLSGQALQRFHSVQSQTAKGDKSFVKLVSVLMIFIYK